MGVPKFFRYISERYPCLSEFVKEHQIPEFDNLYLDMNGIIHMCSHPDDNNPHFRITEERLFQDIFHYIEFLFRMIKPQKVFFLAIDGVAPRAKMNQQRGRRFRSAKEAEKAEAEAKRKGEKLPDEARFDSNCITPGTEFMAKLQEQLKYFIVSKISTDKTWQRCKVILSGHETPGEGEHKIMDYIRYIRSQPGYDPNTRHCLYGLDADLIMLGLCSHDPHFSLLREEVKYGKKSTKRNNVPEEIRFFLLHLSLMREYLELEFLPVKDKLKNFEFDIEKIIDDWVLMGFLVGNDFIPHLPNLHIANGALAILYKAYIDILPTLDGYINEAGTLNLKRFEKFMEQLSSIDLENFEEVRDDLLYMEAKTGRKQVVHAPVSTKYNNEEKQIDKDLQELIEATEEMYMLSSDDEDDEREEEDEDDIAFKQFKDEYYRNKLEYTKVTREVMKDQAEGYVRAIQWNLNYYYNGVCSWSWYYPHHYAPYISDIKGFSDLKIEFDLGKPFKPYEQLLAVLPSASKQLLPKCYHDLMTEDSSLIKEYYPDDFRTDLNGKRQEWEAVVLVPFIDEEKLLEAMKPCNDKLTLEEIKRNSHGPMLIYKYTEEDLGLYEAPDYFPAVTHNYAECTPINYEDIVVPKEKLIKGAYPGAKFDVYYPGFPTMKHLKYKGELRKTKIKIFEQASRNENMVLSIIYDKKDIDEDNLPVDLLGKTVYIGWPHLTESKVVAVSNKKIKVVQGKTRNMTEPNVKDLFDSGVEGIVNNYFNRMAIDFAEIKVLVHVKQMTGRRYVVTSNGGINLEKQYSENITTNFPLQGIVKDIKTFDSCHSVFRDITELFPEGSKCFILTNPHYGSCGTIMNSKDTLKNERLKVNVTIEDEPNFDSVKEKNENSRRNYTNLHNSASQLAISNYVFSRLTGSLFVIYKTGAEIKSVNIGLDLKFNKRNQETPGYTKKIGNTWFYTTKSINLVKDFIENFREIIDYLSHNTDADEIDANEIYGDEAEEKIKSLLKWLKSLPVHNIERRTCNSMTMDPELVKEIEEIVDKHNEAVNSRQVEMQLKPQYLYKPEIQIGNIPPDPKVKIELFDRIVNIREGYAVPLGLKGTVTAIYKSSDPLKAQSDDIYDVVFDKEFPGGIQLNCTTKRAYRLTKNSFINITYGVRLMEEKTGKPGALLALAKANQTTNGFKNNNSNNNFNARRSGGQQQNSAFASFDNHQQRGPITNYGNPYAPQRVMQHHHHQQQQQQQQIRPPNYFMPNFGNSRPVLVAQGSATQYGSNTPRFPLQQPHQQQQQQQQHVDTDFLKKILKISDNSNDNKSKQQQPQQKPILNQIFSNSNLQNKTGPSPKHQQQQQQPVQNAAKALLQHYQANGLGCPRYLYYEKPGGFVSAQLTLPNRKVIHGHDGRSRESASENVAKLALNILLNDKTASDPSLPVPPKDWVQQGRQQTGTSQTKVNQQNSKNTGSVTTATSTNDNKIGASNFVPLQAIIKHNTNKNPALNINKNAASSSSSKNQVKKNNEDKKPTQAKVVENKNIDLMDKRKQPRKTRIAANFLQKS